MKQSNKKDALIFLGPTFLTYVLFLYIPILFCFYLAFTKYDIISASEFVGLKNFTRLFTYSRTPKIYANTLKLVVMLVTMHTVFGLFLALLVRSLAHGTQHVFRFLYYFPCILTTASVAIAWRYIFNKDLGIINYFLSQVGVDAIPWLNDPFWVYGTIAIFSLWKFAGNAFLYFYIGLGNIPITYYEAARIDGANPFTVFKHITFPLLTPTIFFVVLNLFIASSQIFDEPFFLTGGGPGDATRTLNLYIYETAYREFNFGYSSAIAISLFVLLAVFTLIQLNVSKKWVNYDY
ncbi:MAG: sugar ABC transporter permease [Spirochaetia bacterium]|nr:sugar ABC transporter permease [Spirochaetia bacterium]